MATNRVSTGQLDQCPICIEEITQPVKLPCSHIFCYLCAKGAVLQNSRCPMCRMQVPITFFNHPRLVSSSSGGGMAVQTFDGQYHWFYEGRNGWWLYESRTSLEIEEHFKQGEDKCEVLIAGFMYVIDLQNMVQFRRDQPGKTRRIKRDLMDTQATKGVAGVPARVVIPVGQPSTTNTRPQQQPQQQQFSQNQSQNAHNDDDDDVILIED